MLLEGLQILYAVGHSSFGHSGIHLVLTVTVLMLTQGYCYITYNGHYTVDILHGLLWFPDLWILKYCVQ